MRESISIEKYKVFKTATGKNLAKMFVSFGANGFGKSAVFDMFGFLSDVLQNKVTFAINCRGGFQGVLARSFDTKKSSECLREYLRQILADYSSRSSWPKLEISSKIATFMDVKHHISAGFNRTIDAVRPL
jgi:predicted ATPase